MSADGLLALRCARISEHPDVLLAIDTPGVQLAVWRRPRAGEQADRLRLEHGHVRSHRCRLPVNPDWAASAEWQAALVALPKTSALRAALEEVAGSFIAIAAARGLGILPVRIDAIEQRVCRRFHVDHVGLRLLCTVYGVGTDYLPEHAADRQQLGPSGGDVVRNPRAIQPLIAGDIAVLKGHCHPGDPGYGAIHRSPEASAEQPRLLLAADLPG